MPICRTCQIEKQQDGFYTVSGRFLSNCKPCHNATRNNYIRYGRPYQKKPKGLYKFFTDEQRPQAIAELISDTKLSPLAIKYNISYQTLKNLRKEARGIPQDAQ